MINSRTNRIIWIDICKLLAILAVLIDHMNGTLYTDQRIANASYYSVSLFALITGINLYLSYNRSLEKLKTKVVKKIIKIYIPYLVATLIYFIVAFKSFDLEIFLTYVIHFNISGPLYYISLYIQLLIISPVLYYIIHCPNKYYHLNEIAGLIFVILLTYFTMNYSNILAIYGGGGKLFGGTYLILLYLGMLFAKYCNEIKISKICTLLGSIIFAVLSVAWYCFFSYDRLQVDSKLPFGIGFNPPSLSFGLYAIFILLFSFFGIKLLNEIKIPTITILENILGKLGTHTLYIFLYHKLFSDYLIPFGMNHFGIQLNMGVLKTAIYFTIMIAGSLFIEKGLKVMSANIANIYNYSVQENNRVPVDTTE